MRFKDMLRIQDLVQAGFSRWIGAAVFLAAFVGCLLLVEPAMAQTGGQGAIQGTVTDATGAVVPNATVTATDNASGVSTTRKSSSAGLYTITPLIPDSYTVTVTAPGFQTSKQQNIVVNGISVTGYNPALIVGSTDQTVTVTEAPPLLQTTNATLGTVIDNKTYESLPVLMGDSNVILLPLHRWHPARRADRERRLSVEPETTLLRCTSTVFPLRHRTSKAIIVSSPTPSR